MRFKKILRSPTSMNHSLNARSPLGNDERSFAVRCICQFRLAVKFSGLGVQDRLLRSAFLQGRERLVSK